MENKKIKLALIVTVFVTGGAERMVQQLATNLDRSKVELSVISVYPRQNNALEKSIEDAGIPLYFLDKRQSKDPKAIIRMWKLLSKIKPDLIHTHMQSTFYALPWAVAHKVPQLQTIHSSPEIEFSPIQRCVKNWARKAGFLHFGAISQKNQQLIAQYYDINPKQIPWVNNPVELKKYYRAQNRQSNRLTFVNLGRLAEQKNQILAIRAMPQVLNQFPDAQLIIAGEGPLRQELEREIQLLSLEDSVCLCGLVQEPEHLLANADIYLNTSHGEGLPLAILEAEASYLPIIATRVGGVPDIVRDNGFLIEDGDGKALAEAMITLGQNRDLRLSMGEISRSIAMEYDAGNCAREYTAIYQNLLR